MESLQNGIAISIWSDSITFNQSSIASIIAALKQCNRSLNIVCSHVMKFSPSPIFGPIIFCTRVCRHLISVHLLGERSDRPIYPDRRTKIKNAIEYNIDGNISNNFRLKYQVKFRYMWTSLQRIGRCNRSKFMNKSTNVVQYHQMYVSEKDS